MILTATSKRWITEAIPGIEARVERLLSGIHYEAKICGYSALGIKVTVDLSLD